MSKFTFTKAFVLEECQGTKLHVSVTHETATGKHQDVSFHHPDHDQMVSVPADLWDRVVVAVEAQREF